MKVDVDDEALDAFGEQYGGAPAWYWRIQMWLGGWRGEVQWWGALFLMGLALGLLVAILDNLLTI